MRKILLYIVNRNLEREVSEVTLFLNDKIVGQIECLFDSPYTIVEEISNYTIDNNIDYDDIILKNISKEDYVIWNTLHKAPIEAYDTVYHYTSIIEMINTSSFKLADNEEITCIAELPMKEQYKYSYEIEKNK